jgi:peroxiredoxin
MNILKSLFISTYMMATMGITMVAGWSVLNTGDYLAWSGVLLVTAPFMMVISWIMMSKSIARTSARFPVLTALGGIGVLLASWGYFRGASINAPILSLIGWVGFIVYAYWYSSFGRRPGSKLEVGQLLPEFSLRGVGGKSVSSRSLMDRPTVWIFYRGNWCPLCMAQIKELVSQYKQLQALGVRVALVSPQPHKNTMDLAAKFDVPFEFLTDEGNRAGRALGIENPHGLPMGMQMMGYDSESVLPTVVITDADGRILWAHETDNYRIRPEPDVYLAVLREKRVVGEAA